MDDSIPYTWGRKQWMTGFPIPNGEKAVDDSIPYTWGRKQWMNLTLVLLSCSMSESTWNLTWSAAEYLLIPADPLVKARL